MKSLKAALRDEEKQDQLTKGKYMEFGTPVDGEPTPVRPTRAPKKSATGTKIEWRLRDPLTGLYLSVGGYEAPNFSYSGRTWSSHATAVRTWGDYNYTRELDRHRVNRVRPLQPKLVLESFTVVITTNGVEDEEAPNIDTALKFRLKVKGDRETTLSQFVKTAVIFKHFPLEYVIEYRGDVADIPDANLELLVQALGNNDWSLSGKTPGRAFKSFVMVACKNEADMVFIRVALGDKVDAIWDQNGDSVFKREGLETDE